MSSEAEKQMRKALQIRINELLIKSQKSAIGDFPQDVNLGLLITIKNRLEAELDTAATSGDKIPASLPKTSSVD